MTGLEFPLICCLYGVVDLLGVISAWAARLSQGSRRQPLCQNLFFLCLAVVGATGLVAFGLGPGCWLASAATLGIMVLTTVCDFSRCYVAATG